MRSLIEIAALTAASGSAVCWFISAMCRLPSISPGIDELDKVTELSKKMSKWTFEAAGLMRVTALPSVWTRLLG
jgi:hypothetical protein